MLFRSIAHDTSQSKGPRRRGGSAVELALLLPFLVMMLLGTLDLCRMFYAYTIVGECARTGALYASDQNSWAASPYTVTGNQTQSIQNAALAGATDLTPTPTVTSSVNPLYVNVTVTYRFGLITSYLGIGPVTLARNVEMAVAPYP